VNEVTAMRACPYPGCPHEIWARPLTCLLHWLQLSTVQQCRLHHLGELYRLGTIDVVELHQRQQRVLDDPYADDY